MATASKRWLTLLATLMATAFVSAALSAAEADAAKTKVLELNKLTGNGPIEGTIKTLTADADGSKKLIAVGVTLAKDKNKPLNYNAAFVLARVSQDLKDPEACEVFYRYCTDAAVKLQSGDKLTQSFGGLIDLFYDQKKFDKTAQICKEFLDIQGNDTVNRLKPAVMERMIQSLARQKKFDEALKLAGNLAEAEEEEKGWWALSLKAWVLHQAEKADESAKAYETVVERIKGDKTLEQKTKDRYLERNLYLLSNVYIDLKDVDKAAKRLQTLLEMKPDDPTYNNDLGYIWADHDMNLDEAEKMIRKALDEERKLRKKLPDLKPEDDKDNSAYLDSLGWVLYKQKKYKEAKKALEEAIKDKDGQHIEILDHLGDVYKALGEKKEAIATWKKGIESVDKRGNEELPPTKRELDRKKLVEAKIKDESK